MAEGRPAAGKPLDIVPRPQRGIVPRLARQLSKQILYRRYAFKPDAAWTSHTAQNHVRDVALDRRRNQMWLATWGGVLCLSLDKGWGTSHTSEHGLIGNAVRGISVDGDGVVWASSQQRGLCSLLPEEESPWRMHDASGAWTVLRMARRPGGGIYAAVRDDKGRGELRGVSGLTGSTTRLLGGGLAAKEIEAMLVDKAGALWLGNLWGLHRYREDDGTLKSFDFSTGPADTLERAHICALATGAGGGLWVGTNRGVYRFRPDNQPPFKQEPGWPRDQVLSLDEESASGSLWVVTTREVGRIINNVWRPVRKSPPGRLNILRLANREDDDEQAPPSDVRLFRPGRAWVGGAQGLYDVGPDEYEAVLARNAAEPSSHAVQCLEAKGSQVWMGTARGLSSYDGQRWANHIADGSTLGDVRALVTDKANDSLWIGTWRAGLHRLEAGLCTKDESPATPLVSLSAGADGSLWAATAEAISWREGTGKPWQPVAHPLAGRLGGRLIQAICYQLAQQGAQQTRTLWVGTSRGLFVYRPEPAGLWEPVEGDMERLSIQSLALDTVTGKLWVGTSDGLFSEHAWQRHREADVRALAFGPAPEGEVWVGTARQLERWPTPGKGDVFAAQPAALFTSSQFGLAAEEVTSLAIRLADNDQREVWAGSPSGVSCYRYRP